MAQVAQFQASEEWAEVADLISEALGETFTFDAEKTYYIENHGAGLAFFAEPDEALAEAAEPMGVLLRDSNKVIKYKTGTNTLYCRTTGGKATINVTVGE